MDRCRVAAIVHAVSDLSDKFGFADDGSELRRGCGVGKVAMACEPQIPSLDDAYPASTAMER